MSTRRSFVPRGLTVPAAISAVLVVLLLELPGEGWGDEGEAPKDKEASAKEAKKATPPPEGGTDAGQKETSPKRALGIDEAYITENFEKFLRPSSLKFLADGRVKFVFSLFAQDKRHAALFTPKISADVKSRFRWAVPGEASALRISNEGVAHLNVWFKDDVEAEIAYTQATTSKKNQIAALVFTNASGKSIGSNLGTQCALFDSGKLKGGRGEMETVRTYDYVRIKLVVRNGVFEAHRNAEKKETMEYNQKSYTSGKIGFIWAGDLASSIDSLEITGRLDDKKMAELIRKGTPQ